MQKYSFLIFCKKVFTFISNVDSLDWKDSATPDNIAKRVISKVKPGSIVLFHNDAEYTPEALPTILKTLKEQGYEFVFIEDLIHKENYEIIHDGTQCQISYCKAIYRKKTAPPSFLSYMVRFTFSYL